MKIPVIDLRNVEQDSQTWESTKSQVREALQEYGCFEGRFDGIPLDLQRSVLDGVQQLFDLPLEMKLRKKGEIRSQGYIPKCANSPLHQSFGIDDALSLSEVDAFANTLWPQGHPTFSMNIVAYSKELSEVDNLVRRMVVESFGLEKYMNEHLDSTYYVARVQKYDAPRSPEAELGAGIHSDKNIFTTLYQLNQVGGFEFLTKDGQWIAVQPSLNSYIVMVGESLSAWTNGRLHPPLHRVMMTGDEDRYSIALFSIPKAGCMIQAPEEMVDEEHPLLYKPFDYHEYLNFFFTQAGQTSPDALKEFCGA